jgi:DNA mismatch repair protein MutL
MSSVIKILPQFIANRIAAGEVVGRPDAVVKELIENAIDAKAQNIQVRIKDAGKSLIHIIDDGSGMSEEDALLCFQRHSTSKISSADDLENITTLGFRGEALASISAVSQVELKTITAGTEFGTMIKNHGSEIIESEPVSGSQISKGTSVTVKNLFFNTPARRNFLKSNQTEFKHIYETFIREAIAYPSAGFSFINDDEEIFDLKSGTLLERLTGIFGSEFSETLLEVSDERELISVYGYISKPSFTKKTKQDQFLFLNNRYVINRNLSFAVHLAYEDLIEKGDYPNFFLFLKLDPRRFDVNVHPSKLEVKFEDERSIFGFIRKAVWRTLDKNNLIVGINLDDDSSAPVQVKTEPKIFSASSFTKPSSANVHIPFNKNTGSGIIHNIYDNEAEEPVTGNNEQDFLMNIDSIPKQESTKYKHDIDDFSGKNSIWQFQKKYIMYQLENSLMIIDQHAAHERILYEQAVDRLNSNANLSQQLLMPIYVELNAVDYEVARTIEMELRALGFDIELLSKRKVKIRGIPSDVRIGDEGKIIQDIIDEFKENDIKLNLEKRDNLAKSYACKHAIRTGDKLKEDEMLTLIDKLFSTKMPYVCPHGRPTIVKVSMDELDKKFARKGF